MTLKKIALEQFLGEFRLRKLGGMGYTVDENHVMKNGEIQVSLYVNSSKIVIKGDNQEAGFKFIKIDRVNAEMFMAFLDIFPVQALPSTGSTEVLLSALENSNFCEVQR